MLDEKKSTVRSVPTIWNALGAGIATGVIGVVVYSSVFGVSLGSIGVMILILPSILGAIVGLKKRTFKAVWVGAILGFLILPVLVILFIIFGLGGGFN